MSITATKINELRWELTGATHATPDYKGGPVCGGQICAEWFDEEEDDDGIIPGSWECFCVKCLKCDPNGWPTIEECVAAAPVYWMGEPESGSGT